VDSYWTCCYLASRSAPRAPGGLLVALAVPGGFLVARVPLLEAVQNVACGRKSNWITSMSCAKSVRS